jgi:hypothetical protein
MPLLALRAAIFPYILVLSKNHFRLARQPKHFVNLGKIANSSRLEKIRIAGIFLLILFRSSVENTGVQWYIDLVQTLCLKRVQLHV